MSKDPMAARLVLALYPPSWQARYGDEVHALLRDGGGLRDVASLAWRALPAWIWPPAHLYDRPARMRASLSTGLLAWSFLTGLGLVFAQLTQFQGFHPAGHPIIGASYLVFDAALAFSIAAAGLGGLPLWLLMLRRAHREHRRRDVAYLLLPLIAPGAFLAGLSLTVRLVPPGAGGVSPWWFLVITLIGFAAATAAAAGPGLAMRRLQPRGPALRLAATAGGVAAAAIVVAAAAIIVAVTGLSLWARGFAGYHHATVPGVYLALVVVAAAVTAVSAARGTRAALLEPGLPPG
ncbi:MAG: hypothetical protein ACRDOA_09355 [Streptosporangiaceae bacterium]